MPSSSSLPLLCGGLVFLSGCVRGLSAATPEPLIVTAPVVSRSYGDVSVHAVRTGWVSVKEAHRTLDSADVWRIAAILRDATWTEWMPVTAYVIDHPEGVWLVDTGLAEVSLDPAHFACDAGTRWAYEHLLRFRFQPEDRIDRVLARLHIAPERLRGVVFTHRHADHADAFPTLPPSVIAYIGAEDWPTHSGALPCRWPTGRTPVLVPSAEREPHESAEKPLTRDGRLRIVPLPGHSPGHLGASLATADGTLLFVGDAAFSLGQIRTRRIAGVTEIPYTGRRTLMHLAERIQNGPVYVLPCHDPASVVRWADGQRSTLLCLVHRVDHGGPICCATLRTVDDRFVFVACRKLRRRNVQRLSR